MADCEGLGVQGKALLLIRVTTISRDISAAAFMSSIFQSVFYRHGYTFYENYESSLYCC